MDAENLTAIEKSREQLFNELSEFAEEKGISLIAAIELHKLALPEAAKRTHLQLQMEALEQQLRNDGIDIDKI